MIARDAVMLVGADALTYATFARVAESLRDIRILAVDRIGDAMAATPRTLPLLVIARQAPGSQSAFDVCRKVKAHPGLAARVFAVADEPSTIEWDRAFSAGVEAILPWPLTSADLRRLVEAARRVRRLHEALDAIALPLDAPPPVHALGDTWLAPLCEFRDELVPGARMRAERTVEFSHHLAAQFGLPAMWLRDLDRAGRFADLGLIFHGRGGHGEGGLGWHAAARALGTYALMRRIDGMMAAAELTAMINENWNGSGFPRGIARTDIPLRARILRVARDYVDAGESGSVEPGETIAAGAGTLYDPMVIEHFRTLVAVARAAAALETSEIVPVGALRGGMILADDVFTHGGLLLLHEGTLLTPQTIQQILRVHHIEPIRPGISIRRAAAA